MWRSTSTSDASTSSRTSGREFAYAYPQCGKNLGVYGHAEKRTWRHLDSCQFAMILRARIPPKVCPEHSVRQAGVPWREPRSRFTVMFARVAIDVLIETDVADAAKILDLNRGETHHLMQRAVARGMTPPSLITNGTPGRREVDSPPFARLPRS